MSDPWPRVPARPCLLALSKGNSQPVLHSLWLAHAPSLRSRAESRGVFLVSVSLSLSLSRSRSTRWMAEGASSVCLSLSLSLSLCFALLCFALLCFALLRFALLCFAWGLSSIFLFFFFYTAKGEQSEPHSPCAGTRPGSFSRSVSLSPSLSLYLPGRRKGADNPSPRARAHTCGPRRVFNFLVRGSPPQARLYSFLSLSLSLCFAWLCFGVELSLSFGGVMDEGSFPPPHPRAVGAPDWCWGV